MAETFTQNLGNSKFDQGDVPPVCTAAKLNANLTRLDAPIYTTPLASTLVTQSQVTGDTQPRYTVGADGTLSYGSGSVVVDVTTKRGVNNARGNYQVGLGGVNLFTMDKRFSGDGLMPISSGTLNETGAGWLRIAGANANEFLDLTWFTFGCNIVFRNGANELEFHGYESVSRNAYQPVLTLGVAANGNSVEVRNRLDTDGIAINTNDNGTASLWSTAGTLFTQLNFGIAATNYVTLTTTTLQSTTDGVVNLGTTIKRWGALYLSSSAYAGNDNNPGVPSWSFVSDQTTGMYKPANGQLGFSLSGTLKYYMNASGFALNSNTLGIFFGASADTELVRDGAAGALALENGTSACAFHVYGTTTGPHYVSLTHTGAIGEIFTNTTDNLSFGVNAGVQWAVVAAPSGDLQPVTSNANNVGGASNLIKNFYCGTQFLGAAGAVGAPSYSFTANPTEGMWQFAAGDLSFSIGGVRQIAIQSNNLFLLSNTHSIQMGTAQDVILARDAAAIFAVKNGINAQTVRVYGTTTGPKYCELKHDGTDMRLNAQSGVIRFDLASATTAYVDGAGISPITNNTFNLGTSTLGWKNLFFASTAAIATNGGVWYDSTQTTLSAYEAGLQLSKSGTMFTATADVTLNNSASETSMLGTGVGTKTLPANFLVIGKTVRLTIRGKYTTGATPQTLTFKFKLGATVIATLSGYAPVISQTNSGWVFEALFTCRTTGSSGTVYAQADGTFQSGTLTADSTPFLVSTAAVTVNTTVTEAIDFTITTAAADAAATYTSNDVVLEVLN